MSNHDPQRFSYFTDDFTHVPREPPMNEEEETEQDCDCPFPWWLLLVGAAVGGVGGYYAGRRSKDKKKPDELGP